MLTTRANALPSRRLLAGALLVVFTLAACGGAAAPSPTPVPVSPTPQPTPTAVPGDAGNGGNGGNGNGGIGTDPGAGGGSDPGAGGGIVFPIPPNPGDDPNLGDANYLTPGKDLINQHPVNVQLVRALVEEDGSVLADLRWWSGVAPCNQLDRVEIRRDDAAKTIHLTVIEGSGQGDMMCIEIAELHATVVDLGDLPAGTWTVSAEGDAPAIKVEVG